MSVKFLLIISMCVYSAHSRSTGKVFNQDMTCKLTHHSVSSNFHSSDILKGTLYKWNQRVQNFKSNKWSLVTKSPVFSHIKTNLQMMGYGFTEDMSDEIADTRLVTYDTQIAKPSYLFFLPDFSPVSVQKKQYYFSKVLSSNLNTNQVVMHEHSLLTNVPFISKIVAHTTTVVDLDKQRASAYSRISYDDPAWTFNFLLPKVDDSIFDSVHYLWYLTVTSLC